MAVQLFRHNEEAYERVEQMLSEKRRAAVIHPTGTGKSFIALKYCQEHPDEKICWLSPSEYIFRSQVKSFEKVTGEKYPANIVFLTYARLKIEMEDGDAEFIPDCIILDEFHRCGARKWGEGVAALLEACPVAKVLGLSATHIRYLDNGRDMAKELFEKDGELCVASEMTLGEAIVRGILPEPQYVTTMYQMQQQMVQLKKRVDDMPKGMRTLSRRLYDSLRRSVENAEGIEQIFARYITEKTGKYIVFCSDWKHVQMLKNYAAEWFCRVDSQLHCYTLYSGDSETEKEYEEFQKDNSEHLKLLFCIDCLNEGVHLNGISGVILFRPTVSPIIYKQQIGRALTSGKREKPLIIDVVNNLENLSSIGTIRSEMKRAVSRLRLDGKEHLIQTEAFSVIEQAKDCAEQFKQLENCLNCTWDAYYEQAVQYYGVHGNLRVPKRYVTEEGIQLGAWIATQRAVYADCRKGRITQEQIDKLNQIGMQWGNQIDTAWDTGFEHAKTYYETYHDLLVTDGYKCEDGYPLGHWIAYLRNRKSENLSEERIQRLDSIGMSWDAFDAKWEKRFAQAKQYYLEHGNLRIPATYRAEDGFCLGMWIVNQRKAREDGSGKNSLTDEQIQRLSQIGMQWCAAYSQQWQSAYEEAKSYYETNGNLNVPYSYCTESGFKLGRWINRQRSAGITPGKGSNTRMTRERAMQLERIGMQWHVAAERAN